MHCVKLLILIRNLKSLRHSAAIMKDNYLLSKRKLDEEQKIYIVHSAIITPHGDLVQKADGNNLEESLFKLSAQLTLQYSETPGSDL